ncbi:TMEM199 [Acanthosepion pharaonis]|uniref:TMEM199 n=1 Tax=Acanthosepion pharaonis TaxID=158019 RepID=A0A812AX12_ACAPH|nr:TMEM199 [Sepia pharaonis]
MVYEAEICITSNLRRSLAESLSCDRLERSAKTELRKLLLDDYTESSNKSTVVPIRLVKAVHKALNQERMEPIYLHEMLEGCELHLPEYTAPPRNPELETRIQRLKAEAAEREYKKMTKNVASPETFYKENLGHEMKAMNNQIIAVVNFAVTVVGAFVFGYKGSEAAMEIPNVAIQLTVAMILATIVFFADLYFLIKKTM